MKKLCFAITLCLLFGACVRPAVALPPTADVTALPEMTPGTVPTPTASATPTLPPPPTNPPRDWNIEDNGIDGVGSVRGNTNGNISVGGRAVDVGDSIFYTTTVCDADWNPSQQLVMRDKASKTERVVFSDAGRYNHRGIRYLNWYKGILYFALENDIYAYNPEDESIVCIYEREGHKPYLYSFHVAYDLLFVSYVLEETVCLDIHTYERVYQHEGLYVSSIMDGRLYGYYEPNNNRSYISMYPDGTDLQPCAPVMIASDGKLYYLESHLYASIEIDILYTTDLASGETIERPITEILDCGCWFNVSRKGIYIQGDFNDGAGPLYLMSLDGKWKGQISSYYFDYGVTIIDGQPAFTLGIPCDLERKK